jgi:LacI family transcriptional regulator
MRTRRSFATLRDVARAAGVHPGTVSRALSPETRRLVNEETALEIQRIAQELGYQPDHLARGLRTGRSRTVGVIVPHLTNPLFPPIVCGVEERLEEAGYIALITNIEGHPERGESRLRTLMTRQVEGLIIASAWREDDVIQAAREYGIPSVLVLRIDERADMPAVVPDDVGGAAAAVRHLIELGHTRIAHICGPPTVMNSLIRRDVYVAEMRGHGLEVRPEWIVTADSYLEEAGAAATHALIDRDPSITAIFATNDLVAIGCFAAMAEHGLSCPRDISVVGFNDILFADKINPPLTTLDIHPRRLGELAADLLLGRLENAELPPQRVTLETSLVVRGSTAPPPSTVSRNRRSRRGIT